MKVKDEQFEFLSDSPLAGDVARDLSFGHKSIADSLVKIVQYCPKPFTIGLFGKWGTGKTTIIHWLTNQLDKNHFCIVHIDAWKYEGDSLRRQFLITLDEELELGLDYKKVLNQSLSEVDPTKGNFKFDKSMFLNRIGVVILVITLLALVLKVIAANPSIPFLPKFSVSFDLLFNLGFAGYLIQLGLSLFQRVSVTITEPRTDSAEGFERRFTKDVLKHRKLENKTVLLIIDNLDRCSDEKAVEMLITIKTFLIKETEKNKCIFLIACDDEAIKKHVTKLYADPNSKVEYNAEEFLRKFFNTFIRIPRFIDTELQSYTESLLKETKVPELDSSEVAHVITSVFRENPRQIKQFINVLLSHFLLAQQRENEESSLIPKDTVTGHVPFLAKILVIQIRFSEIYEKILSDYLSFEEAERLDENNKEYQNFIRATKAIPSTDIRAFLYFKQSEHERAIPGYDELRAALEENNIEIIQKKIEAIKGKPEQVASLERLLPDIIQQHKKRRTVLLNIVSGSLEALHKVNLSLQGEYYNKIADLFTDDGELRDDLSQLEPRLVFEEILPRCISSHRTFIVNKYKALFITKPKDEKARLAPDFISGLFEQFLGREEWIKDSIASICQAIVEQYFTHTKVMRLLVNNEERLKKYFSEEGIVKFIETFTNADIDNSEVLKSKTEILKGLKPIASISIGKKLLQQYFTLLNNEQQKPMREQREVLLITMVDTLRNYKGAIADTSNRAELSALSQKVIISGDWKQKEQYIPLCLLLTEIDQSNRPNLNSQIQAFLNSADLKSIKEVLESLSPEERAYTISQFNSQFNQRVQQDKDILTYMYDVASSEIRIQWLVNVIASPHYPNALIFLEERKYKVDDDKPIIEALLNRVKGINPPEKNKVYGVINGMGWKKCDELKDIYAAQIRELLTQTNVQLQVAGEEALKGAKELDESHRREIIRPTIEWLDSQSAGNASQQSAIRSVLANWGSIKEQEAIKSKFIEFTFYKLIIGNNSVDAIKFGFEVLQKVDPPIVPDKYNSHFADIQSRIDREGNNIQLKEVLGNGLNGFGVQTKSESS